MEAALAAIEPSAPTAIPLVSKNLVYARTQNVDFGHELVSVRALYPGIDETTMVTT